MEEILQSIKRIIAEENQDSADAPDSKKTAKSAPPKPTNGSAVASDVLELTDVADEAEDIMEALEAVVEEEEEPAPQPFIAAASASTGRSESILEAVDRSPARETHKDVLDDIDTLLSSEAARASSNALKSLQSKPKAPAPAPTPVNPGMPFRSGNTVEDLAMEALRPMLQDWLNNNLPGIVERLVEREVKKLSNQ